MAHRRNGRAIEELILQFIACGDEAGALGDFDIRWKIPERHRFRR